MGSLLLDNDTAVSCSTRLYNSLLHDFPSSPVKPDITMSLAQFDSITGASLPRSMGRVYLWLALVLVFVGLSASKSIKRFLARRRVTKLYGCGKPAHLEHIDKLLGTDIFFHSYDGIKRKRYLSICQQRFRQQGSTYIGNMLGTNVINTCDPQNVKAILATQFDEYDLGSRRANAFRPLLGHGIFTADGEHWKNARRLLRPSFSRDQIANFDLLGLHARQLVDVIDAHQSEHGCVDLQPLFFRLTLDTATELFFGESCHSLRSAGAQDHDSSQFAQAFDRTQRVLADNFVLGPLAKLPFIHPSFNRDRDTIYKFIDKYVERAINLAKTSGRKPTENPEKSSEPYVVLEEMAHYTKDAQQLRSDILNLMVAGRDTTASLLSNMWFQLAKNERVFQALREEIDALDGALPDYVQLKEMKYLQACIRESLRLHPPVPLNSRTANCNTILPKGGGVDGEAPVAVPAGTVVSFNAYAMHRRKDIWGDDANEFRPERWDGRRTHWEFLPFNGGPRICLGQQLALTEAAFFTTVLLQTFPNIESLNEEPWRESLTLTCCSKDGTRVRLRRGEGTRDPRDFQPLVSPVTSPIENRSEPFPEFRGTTWNFYPEPYEIPPPEGPPLTALPLSAPLSFNPFDTIPMSYDLDTKVKSVSNVPDIPAPEGPPLQPLPLTNHFSYNPFDTIPLEVAPVDNTIPEPKPRPSLAALNTKPIKSKPLDSQALVAPVQIVAA